MANEKIAKNVSSPAAQLVISDVGVEIDASGTYTIPEQDYLLWAASVDAQTAISAGDLILNDGVEDLSAARSSDYIQHPHRAFNVRFDSDPERTNGFSSRNVQEAIEEVRDLVAGKIVEWDFDSTGVTFNKWLNVGHPSVTSDAVPFVSPWAGNIVGIGYANQVDESNTDIEIYVNGTLEYTWDIRDKRTAWIVDTGGLVSISQGDRVSVFARDAGSDDPRDISGQLLAQLLPFSNGEGGTTTGV